MLFASITSSKMTMTVWCPSLYKFQPNAGMQLGTGSPYRSAAVMQPTCQPPTAECRATGKPRPELPLAPCFTHNVAKILGQIKNSTNGSDGRSTCK
jgi:hypothetical protein